jgi:hypothetical protein
VSAEGARPFRSEAHLLREVLQRIADGKAADPQGFAERALVLAAEFRQKRAERLAAFHREVAERPKQPGFVYVIRGESGPPLYVGKTREPAIRLGPNGHPEKAWWPLARSIEVFRYADEATALIAEKCLIRALAPTRNRERYAASPLPDSPPCPLAVMRGGPDDFRNRKTYPTEENLA